MNAPSGCHCIKAIFFYARTHPHIIDGILKWENNAQQHESLAFIIFFLVEARPQ